MDGGTASPDLLRSTLQRVDTIKGTALAREFDRVEDLAEEVVRLRRLVAPVRRSLFEARRAGIEVSRSQYFWTSINRIWAASLRPRQEHPRG